MRKTYTYRIVGIGPLRGHNGRLGVGSHDGRGGGGVRGCVETTFGRWRRVKDLTLYGLASRGRTALCACQSQQRRPVAIASRVQRRVQTQSTTTTSVGAIEIDFGSGSILAMDPEHASSPRDLNDLFDYDVGLDDIFEGNASQTANAETSKPSAGNSSALGLGLDEEVKVTKKRQPVAKLDEGRWVNLRRETPRMALTSPKVYFPNRAFPSFGEQQSRSSSSKAKDTR